MSLHYIIDGYNLIKHRSFRPPNNIHDPRFALIQLLRREQPFGSPKNKVTIVFDGYSQDSSLRGLEFEVIFSCDDSADLRIKKIVEAADLPKSLMVVSDDRQIRDFARLCGATSLGVEDFLNPVRKISNIGEGEQPKARLSYSAAHKINEELRKRWLKNEK